MHPEDNELVDMAKSGNMDAFEELVTRYETKVYTIAYRFTGNHTDASDLAQEAFIKAYKGLISFRGEASFATWLYRIVSNVCRDELRKQQRQKNISLDDMMIHSGNAPYLVSTELSPQESLERNELNNLIQEQLNGLSKDQRLILVMREIQGLSYEEISVALDCNLGTVKSRLNRARQSLKQSLWKCREHFDFEIRLTDKGEGG